MTDVAPIRPESGDEVARALESTTKKVEVSAPAVRARLNNSPARKAVRSIFASSAKDLGAYLLQDVVLPAARDLVVSTVTDGINRAVYGASARPSHRGYGSFVTRNAPVGQRRDYSAPSRGEKVPQAFSQPKPSYEDLEYSSRQDAQSVLSFLVDTVEQYGTVTIGDLYERSSVSTSPVDQKWGWRDLSVAGIRRTRTGYTFDLPEAEWLR